MVASKRGRGARNQAAKAKPAEEPVAAAAPEPAPADAAAEAESEAAPAENNGTEQAGAEAVTEAAAEAAEGEAQTEAESAEAAEAAAEAAKKAEEEKVESGKILVENLPVSYLFDYQEKLKDLFSKYGDITLIKRGPNVVTELTTTPTLSAIIEFKNKDSLDKALSEDGALVDGSAISVCVESRAETAVLVGVPYEAGSEYVRLLFEQAGSVAHIHEFSKTKYKILRVTFHEKESVEKALKLDRELRLNGFLVTVSKYRDDDEQKAHNATISKQNVSSQNKRQHSQNRNSTAVNANTSPNANNANSNRNNAFRARGGAGFNTRGNFRGEHYGARGRGGFQRGGGGAFPRPSFAPVNTYMPPQGFMGRPGGFMDGQRPNKRLRQM